MLGSLMNHPSTTCVRRGTTGSALTPVVPRTDLRLLRAPHPRCRRPFITPVRWLVAAANEASALAEPEQEQRARPDPADNVLYVAKLPKDIDDAGVAELAKDQHGLQKAFMYRKAVGNHVGYLVFDTPEAAAAAQQALDNKEFRSKTLRVKVHKVNEEKPKPQARTRRNNPNNQQNSDSDSDTSSGSGSDQTRREQQRRQQQPSRKAARTERPEGTAVYVRNLAWATLSEDLREHFSSSCDGVRDAFITTRRDGKPSGSGFVLFESPEAAAAAVEKMGDTKLDGRAIVAELARRRDGAGQGAVPGAASESSATAEAPAAAAAAAAAETQVPSALQAALSGAADDERRVVIRNGPEGFGWREYLGMCSVFGQVEVVTPRKPPGSDAGAATPEASGSSSSASSGSSSKAKPFVIVKMVDKEAAESVVNGLFSRVVQGSKLTVMMYKPKKQKSSKAQPMEDVDSGSSSSGNEQDSNAA